MDTSNAAACMKYIIKGATINFDSVRMCEWIPYCSDNGTVYREPNL